MPDDDDLLDLDDLDPDEDLEPVELFDPINSGSGFPYWELDVPERNAVRTATAIIQTHRRERRKSAFVIGRELRHVKDIVHRGHWSQWLACEFDWSHDTAARFIRIFDITSQPEFRILRFLPIPTTTLYSLVAKHTPTAVRGQGVDDWASGLLDPKHPPPHAEIMRRRADAMAGITRVTAERTAESADIEHRDYAMAAKGLLKARLTADELR